MKAAVIGAGSWGTALAQVLALNGHNVSLWARDAKVVRGINENGYNPRYVSNALLSDNIVATTSYSDALRGAKAAVIVTPSKLLRGVGQAFCGLVADDLPIIVCSKGVEGGSGLLPVEVFEAELGGADRLAVLSGPNHAEEVIRAIPAGTVVASSSAETAAFFQDLFASDTFRVYTSSDVTGVELCAAFKNVIAIAVGIAYGIGFGDNTAAMLMTRGLAEMNRLVCACGGLPLTCLGLAGAGDLIATCTSQHSRNRRFGEMIARGGTMASWEAETSMVAEGALACKTLDVIARAHAVELPITDAVRNVVWEGGDARTLGSALINRPLTTEFYGIDGPASFEG
ncbi:NAD(P)H-dependent glycerol-3-phosphate dehydrogenase [Eggerthellaceae bacterium zg-887]|uniref:NAD(P)H-dependent glycerol-3-phosphate dehydrogenase n=1 Tax=Xiamenia xianingshaonis TaxID=2682776 RepID=UPI0014090488|nr:NAD(P)H-dependent glycerol-3-phosphate dehydrogenase [Xiamenia xianingshaonis]NHM16017.1 NAD(P)H-dependent glycerol-3-phosphate dehydrogenase [Xiamenia xianingshaonis]